jgi:hypothetical protein
MTAIECDGRDAAGGDRISIRHRSGHQTAIVPENEFTKPSSPTSINDRAVRWNNRIITKIVVVFVIILSGVIALFGVLSGPRRPAVPYQSMTERAVLRASRPANLTGPTYPASFDCAKAISVPEQLICHDKDMSSADRELATLRQRTRSVIDDPVAFRRYVVSMWRYRQATCRDRDCLLKWYANEREMLEGVIRAGHFPVN